MEAEHPAYEREPYRSRLTTSVVSSGEEEGRPYVVLRDTPLYPEGGGQPCDLGAVGGVAVEEVRRHDGEVRHYLAAPVVDGSVEVTLDWARRYDHMQQHTAQHLLSALFQNRFGWATTSFHLGEARCDIELDVADVPGDVLAEIEGEFMEAVRASVPVVARRVSIDRFREMNLRGRGLPEGHQGTVRLVEIEGVDTTACGGTHLRSTAEIESIHLGPTERMRGGTRLFWLAGGRVRRRLRDLEERVGALRGLFETSEEELSTVAGARLETLKSTSRELRDLRSELARTRAASLAASHERVVEAHFDDVDGGFLASAGRALVAEAPGKCALLTASTGKGHFFLVAAGADSGLSLAEAGPAVAAALEGRGGGSGTSFQGKAGSLAGRAAALDALREAAEVES